MAKQIVVAQTTATGYPIQVATYKSQTGLAFAGTPANSGVAGAQIGTSPVALTVVAATFTGYQILGVRLRWSADVIVQLHDSAPATGSFPVDADVDYIWYPGLNPTLYVDASAGSTNTFYEVTCMQAP